MIKYEKLNPIYATDEGETGVDISEQAAESKNKEHQFSDEEFEKLIQAKIDKYMADEKKKNAALSKELETLKREKLTDEEIKQDNDARRDKELTERERNVLLAENKLYAIEVLKETGLDDGSKSAMDLINIVLDEDRDVIKSNIKALDTVVKARVKAEVEKVFKNNSRTPEKAGNSQYTTNPYAKETYNLTQQMKLEVENPELAKKLQSMVKR